MVKDDGVVSVVIVSVVIVSVVIVFVVIVFVVVTRGCERATTSESDQQQCQQNRSDEATEYPSHCSVLSWKRIVGYFLLPFPCPDSTIILGLRMRPAYVTISSQLVCNKVGIASIGSPHPRGAPFGPFSALRE